MGGMEDPLFWMAYDTAKAAGNAKAKAREWKSYAEELEAENGSLIKQLAQEQMHTAGLTAVVNAFKAQHPNSSLMEAINELRKDGSPKTKVTRIYQEAHDKKGRELGISDPEQYRA